MEIVQKWLLILITCFFANPIFSQIKIEAGDPPNHSNIPEFYKSKLADIDSEINQIQSVLCF